MINDWAKILDNKGQVDTFILDFEKAFDTPPHEQVQLILIYKYILPSKYIYLEGSIEIECNRKVFL